MSELSDSYEAQPAPRGRDAPALGIVALPERTRAVAAAVLRAQRHGLDVYVHSNGAPECEAVELARTAGAKIVGEAAGTPDNPWVNLREVTRQLGHPGLIQHENLTDTVDFDQCLKALERHEEYGLPAITVSTDTDHPEVMAGVPANDEAMSIGTVVIQADEFADEVVVIDDGSNDDTADVAERAGATVIEHDDNIGKGAAVRTLFEHARSVKPDVLVLLDGDGQHQPADIPAVIQPAVEGEADVVIGSRYITGGDGHETPRYRRFGQRVLDILTMGSSGLKVSDSQSGFRALSPVAYEKLNPQSSGFEVESELIDAAARNGLEITERPIEVRYEGVDGSDANPFHHGLSVVSFLLQLIRDRHPLVFFGLPGAILTALGIVHGIDAILIYRATGQFYPAKVLVSGFVTIIGVLGVFLGVVLNSFANWIRRVQDAGRITK